MSLGSLPDLLEGLEYEFSGGVSDADIERASGEIRLPFSGTYADFLRLHGSGFISFHELVGLGGPPHLDVVSLTLHLRSNSGPSSFPEKLIPILADGYGNYECLDTSTSNSWPEFPIVQWLHDGGDDQPRDVIAASYEEWLFRLVDQIRAIEASDRKP